MFNEKHGYQNIPPEDNAAYAAQATLKEHQLKAQEIQPRPLTADDVNRGYDAAFHEHANGEPGEAHLVFDQTITALAQGLGERTEPISEAELATALQSVEGDTSAHPADVQWENQDNPFRETSIDPTSVEAQALKVMDGLKEELKTALAETGKALAEGDTDSAATIARTILSRCEAAGLEQMSPETQAWYEGIKKNLQAVFETDNPTAKSRLYKLACGAADFIPVVGPAKMLAEAAQGQTLGGDTLTGWKRFLHGAEGLTFLAIDLTGFGAVATKLAKAGKGGLMSAKLLTRTAALMRVLKVPRQAYMPVFRAGAFLLRHPRLAQLATRGIEGMAKGRKLRLTKELPETLIANPTERDGMELDTPPDYELAAAA